MNHSPIARKNEDPASVQATVAVCPQLPHTLIYKSFTSPRPLSVSGQAMGKVDSTCR
jgi:hypothetical protein